MRLTLLITSLLLAGITLAQPLRTPSRNTQIGPRGTDTSIYSTIYVIREKDDFADTWFALQAESYYAFCAKVNQNNAYKLCYPPNGLTEFYFETPASGRTSVLLALENNSVHYLQLTVSGTKNNPEVKLEELDSASGTQLLQKYSNRIHTRFSTIPYQFSQYVSDKFFDSENVSAGMKDSIHYTFDKQQYFTFLLPPRLDFMMTAPEISTAYGFYSLFISESYSEVFTLQYIGKPKVKKADDFEKYALNEIEVPFKQEPDRYKNYKFEVIKKQDHAMGGLNLLVYATYEDHRAANKKGQKFINVHDFYRVITWKDVNGTTQCACFILSERGLTNELCTKEEFTERFNALDKTIQLHTNRTKDLGRKQE